MDWKYKHFQQERILPASPDTATQAAIKFVQEELGWSTETSSDGFTAAGSSFGHGAKAIYRFQPDPNGTRMSIDLLVERAGVNGFMLFDVGGYYNIQIRKWFDQIQSSIQPGSTGAAAPAPAPVAGKNKNAARLFNGCMLLTFLILGLWFLGNFISAMVGLLTGTLYLWGKGGTLVLHGVVARITAAVIILFGLFLAWRVLKSRRH